MLPGGKRNFVFILNELDFYYDDPDCIICQSTNLFDKDGKEIFEGTIVEDEFNETLGYVYYEPEVCAWRIKFNDGEEDDGWTLENSTSNLRSVDHILSSPELVEKKDV